MIAPTYTICQLKGEFQLSLIKIRCYHSRLIEMQYIKYLRINWFAFKNISE